MRERDSSQPERSRRDTRPGLIKSLFRIAQPASEKRSTEHKQEIADNRTGDGCLDDAGESLAQRDEADDKLSGIAECRIKKTADTGTGDRSQLFGRTTHPAGQRNNRDPSDKKEQGLIPPGRHVSENNRNRHGEQQQIERRKRPTGFSLAWHASIGA